MTEEHKLQKIDPGLLPGSNGSMGIAKTQANPSACNDSGPSTTTLSTEHKGTGRLKNGCH